MSLTALDNRQIDRFLHTVRGGSPLDAFLDSPLVDTPFAPLPQEEDLLTKRGKLSPDLKRDIDAFLAANPQHPFAKMDGSELTQLLVDYLSNGLHQQSDRRPEPPRVVGSLGGPTFSNPSTPTTWSPGVAPSGGAAPTAAPQTGATPASTTPLNAEGLGDMKHATAEQLEKILPAAAKPFIPQIMDAAKKHDMPPLLIASVIQQESNFDPSAGSPAGAQGLMQLMPDTARSLGVSNPNDPGQSIDAGTKYLRQQLDQFGSLEEALAAYNAGPGNVEQYGGVPPFAETQSYVEKIPAQFEAWRKELPASFQGGPRGADGAKPSEIAQIPNYEELAPELQRAAADALRMGLTVTSTTGGTHTPSSNHYAQNSADGHGHAIDVAGSPQQMQAFYERYAGTNPTELFYDPSGGIKDGQQIGAIGGHSDHVHLAIG